MFRRFSLPPSPPAEKATASQVHFGQKRKSPTPAHQFALLLKAVAVAEWGLSKKMRFVGMECETCVCGILIANHTLLNFSIA
jgi:hypothetical protein